jgi:dihydrofolate reductase
MSRHTDWANEEAETALYPGRAIEIAYADGCEECWVIGGAQIYGMYLDRVDEIHVTTVHTTGSGEVSFPKWDKSGWTEETIESLDADDGNEHSTKYSIWTRSGFKG